jgi:methyl-accepting chemotaxis protein
LRGLGRWIPFGQSSSKNLEKKPTTARGSSLITVITRSNSLLESIPFIILLFFVCLFRFNAVAGRNTERQHNKLLAENTLDIRPTLITFNSEDTNLSLFNHQNELSCQQEQRLKKIQLKDQKIDEGIHEVGLVADRLEEISRGINSEVKTQKDYLNTMDTGITDNVEKIAVVNKKLDKTTRKVDEEPTCILS